MCTATATRPARSTLRPAHGIAGAVAPGGAYDAALARGRSSLDAMACSSPTGRPSAGRGRERTAHRRRPLIIPSSNASAPPPNPDAESWSWAEPELGGGPCGLGRALRWPPRVLRAEQARVWSRATLVKLGCGFAGGRVLIPIQDARGELCGTLRYAPSHDHAPKMLAVAGTRLGLIPNPAAEPSESIVLVEGPPNAISARSYGPARESPLPGDDAWEAGGRSCSLAAACRWSWTATALAARRPSGSAAT